MSFYHFLGSVQCHKALWTHNIDSYAIHMWDRANIMNILSINCGLCATGVHHFLHMHCLPKGLDMSQSILIASSTRWVESYRIFPCFIRIFWAQTQQITRTFHFEKVRYHIWHVSFRSHIATQSIGSWQASQETQTKWKSQCVQRNMYFILLCEWWVPCLYESMGRHTMYSLSDIIYMTGNIPNCFWFFGRP